MYKIALKSAVVMLISTVLLFVSGCFGGNDSLSDMATEKSFQGEIQELTALISDLDATHVLVTTAKERVYLRSILFDLDQYVGKNVRVFGAYSEAEISSKPVDVVTVTQIDILSGEDEVSFVPYESSLIGLSFNYPESFFEITTTTSGISLVHDGSSIDKVNFKIFKSSPELDASLYIKKAYPNETFVSLDDNGFANLRGYTNSSSDSAGKLIFVFSFDKYFFEVNTYTSNEDFILYLNDILSSIKYIGSPTFKFPDTVSSPEILENTEPSTNTPPAISSSKYKSTIDSFVKNAASVISNFKSAVSFSFTDNGYFYLVYLNESDLKRRALIKYDGSNFVLVASFEPGAKEDWKLVSGNNVAYDRPQTFVPISLTGNLKEVEVKKGFRYFESLPLGFSSQYPQNWYYTREDNQYYFSDKPLDESESKIKIIVLNSTNLPAYSESAGTITYNVKLDGFSVSVSGSAEYANYLKVMAESVLEIKD